MTNGLLLLNIYKKNTDKKHCPVRNAGCRIALRVRAPRW